MSSETLRLTDPGDAQHHDLQLDRDGVARNPVVLLDADQGAGLPRRIRPIVIAVAQRSTVSPEVRAVADVVIARPGLCPGAVETQDPFGAAAALAARITASPKASLTLAWLLRSARRAEVPDALAAESAAYSMLLASSEFRSWLAQRGAPRAADAAGRIKLTREGDLLRITLARAQRRNAVDTLMRHALLEALRVAQADPSLLVEIDAEGPSFSAGGDLDEFGTATDPGTAHLVRVGASVGQLIHDLRARVVVRLHGACIGAGIELPAFAGRVIADADAYFGLPELAMGLIPGAGGTVGIPARIGAGRTFWLAASGEQISCATALQWGLVDELG